MWKGRNVTIFSLWELNVLLLEVQCVFRVCVVFHDAIVNVECIFARAIFDVEGL